MHHGILGQKWGVRRFQNKDGSLTALGKKHRGFKGNVQKATTAYATAREKYAKNRTEANAKKVRLAQRAIDDEKIKEKLSEEKRLSKTREKLENKYRAQGMSKEEAAIAAYKNVHARKIFAAVLGITAAAAVGYAGYKIYQKKVDKVISKDILLKRIATNGDIGVHDAFYAAFGKDANRYKGFLGDTFAARGNDVFQKTINLNADLKIASRDNARKTLNDIVKTDDTIFNIFKKNLMDYGNNAGIGGGQPEVFKKAAKSLDKGKVDGNVYNAFNIMLAGNSNQPLVKAFYRSLKEKGYDGIEDLNDKFFSDYNTKKPTIIFNKDKIKDISVKKLENIDIKETFNKEMKRYNNEEFVKNLAKEYKPYAAIMAGGGTAVATGSAKKQTSDTRAVSNYRKEHPNTKLSNAEILEAVR